MSITAIVAYSKGFACTCGPGSVHIFEKTDDREFYRKTREIRVRTIFSISLAENSLALSDEVNKNCLLRTGFV